MNGGFSLEFQISKPVWSVIINTFHCQVEVFIEKLKTQMQCIIQRKVLIPIIKVLLEGNKASGYLPWEGRHSVKNEIHW